MSWNHRQRKRKWNNRKWILFYYLKANVFKVDHTSGSISGYLRPLLFPKHFVFPPSSSWHQKPFLGSNLNKTDTKSMKHWKGSPWKMYLQLQITTFLHLQTILLNQSTLLIVNMQRRCCVLQLILQRLSVLWDELCLVLETCLNSVRVACTQSDTHARILW